MFKLIRRIFNFIIIVLLLVVLGFVGYGYFEYQDAIKEKPISEAVEDYWSKEGYASYDELNQDFINAVISGEDKRFFSRKGIDFIALARAIINNIANGEIVEGGSTISQQVAKNMYFYQESSYVRKVSEVFLMNDLEGKYTKKEIFALYVNMNYYGDGYWGIREAAKGYFNVEIKDLTLAQSAILAAIPNAPAVYQLSSGYSLAKERQEYILDNMVSNGYISKEEASEARKEDLGYGEN